MKIGDPLDESTTLGPLSSKDALDTLSKQVDEAVKNGAKLHLGGKAVAREGNFFEPTILTGITQIIRRTSKSSLARWRRSTW